MYVTHYETRCTGWESSMRLDQITSTKPQGTASMLLSHQGNRCLRQGMAGRNDPVKPACDIILCTLLLRLFKDLLRLPELDHLAEQEERCVIRYSRSLLHVVCHDDGCVFAFQLTDQVLDSGSRDRIKRATRLIKEYHFRLYCKRSCNAEPLRVVRRRCCHRSTLEMDLASERPSRCSYAALPHPHHGRRCSCRQ